MKVYPAHYYRDPLANVIAQEGRTCKGCYFLHSIEIQGERKEYCENGKKAIKKCTAYRETA